MKKFFKRILMSFRMRLFGISIVTIKSGDMILIKTDLEKGEMTESMLEPTMDYFREWFEGAGLHGCKLYFFARGESIEILRPGEKVYSLGELDEKEVSEEKAKA